MIISNDVVNNVLNEKWYNERNGKLYKPNDDCAYNLKSIRFNELKISSNTFQAVPPSLFKADSLIQYPVENVRSQLLNYN